MRAAFIARVPMEPIRIMRLALLTPSWNGSGNTSGNWKTGQINGTQLIPMGFCAYPSLAVLNRFLYPEKRHLNVLSGGRTERKKRKGRLKI